MERGGDFGKLPIERGLASKPVGSLRDSVDQEFVLQGSDQAGELVEWIVRPTGANSFNITVPDGHELGSPAAWENIAIMTQRVVTQGVADNCGCNGSQCGCQGGNCGSNCGAQAGHIRLLPSRSNPAILLSERLGGGKRPA